MVELIDPELSAFLYQIDWKCENGIFIGTIPDTSQAKYLLGIEQSGKLSYATVGINHELDTTLHWYRGVGIITFRAINIVGKYLI